MPTQEQHAVWYIKSLLLCIHLYSPIAVKQESELFGRIMEVAVTNVNASRVEPSNGDVTPRAGGYSV